MSAVEPEVRAIWPMMGLNDPERLDADRVKIDELGPVVHAAFAAGYEFFLELWLINGKRGVDWTARVRRSLLRYVIFRCRQQNVHPLLTRVYYIPLFSGMIDHLVGLLGDGKVDWDFLIQGLPQNERRNVTTLENLNFRGLGREFRNSWFSSRVDYYNVIFNLAEQRLAIVMDVGLAKGPDVDPHVPSREEDNRRVERERCFSEGISREITERYYVRTLQTLMNAATDVQYSARRSLELFRLFVDQVSG